MFACHRTLHTEDDTCLGAGFNLVFKTQLLHEKIGPQYQTGELFETPQRDPPSSPILGAGNSVLSVGIGHGKSPQMCVCVCYLL